MNRGVRASLVFVVAVLVAFVACRGAQPGMREISVRVDGADAWFVVPGAAVDVVLTQNVKRRIVVANVRVVASAKSAVTLQVTPADAERIELALASGKVALTRAIRQVPTQW